MAENGEIREIVEKLCTGGGGDQTELASKVGFPVSSVVLFC